MSMSKRFRQLEDAFDLDSAQEDDKTESPVMASDEDVRVALSNADEIDRQLAQVRGKDEHDREMDELADLAIKAHQDLQDLGMNVEIRHAGEIFSSSSQMLKIAVDAKNNKVEKKLRMLRLQLDKLKLDRATKSNGLDPIDAQATVLDRNALLKQLSELDKDAK